MTDIKSLILTIKLALIVTPFLVISLMPLSYFISFKDFYGKNLIRALLNLPLFIPPTVLGFFLLAAMSPESFLGQTYENITGQRLVFTFQGLVLALTVSNIPYAFQPMSASFEKLDKRLVEASKMLGFSELKTFFMVIIPNSIGGIAASSALVFSHCLGEFGVVLMVGGAIPGRTKTASVSIFESVEMLDYSGAFKMSAILLVTGL
ncbi:MAG: ABC transporter permease subunit, partial [Desulfobacteraceae bacterium]|nr:ABC transporter permease subunit [Desulfobacteraceae bacterium]